MGCLVPLLALAAGTGLQAAGAAQAQDAMNRRTRQELERQRQIQQKSRTAFATSLSSQGEEPATKKIDEGQAQREQAYKQIEGVPVIPTSAVAPQGSAAITLRDAATRTLGNRSRAQLSGYDTWLLDQAVKNLRTNQELAQNTQEAQRSQAILPMELQTASHAGDTLAGLGSLVSMAGSLYGMMPSKPVSAAARAAVATPFVAPLGTSAGGLWDKVAQGASTIKPQYYNFLTGRVG